MTKHDVFPDHPGIILWEEFLQPLAIKPGTLARILRVSRDRVSELVKGQRDITPDTAVRLGAFFGISPEFWLNLQHHYDVVNAQAAVGMRMLRVIAASRKDFDLSGRIP